MLVKNKKLTGRQMRMQHFKSLHGKSGLNLVSLMDIFTILVFFLLVNSSSQQLPSTKDVKLPTSIANKVPQENLIILVTKDSILVAGHKVANVTDSLASAEPTIKTLADELQFQASKTTVSAELAQANKLSVTIMGDETIPYGLMSKILATCRNTNYTNIAFAAVQNSKSKS